MGHEKIKESDLNWPLPLTIHLVKKATGKGLIRCGAEVLTVLCFACQLDVLLY